MTVAESIHRATAKGDITGIRIMMKNSLLVDLTFAEFHEMENLTQNLVGLYDSHDGREFNLDKSAWNDDYMNRLMVQVVGNFSHERINHLKDVVRHLRPVASRSPESAPNGAYTRHKAAERPAQEPHLSYHQQKQQDERNNQIANNRGTKIAAGAIAGGVVGGVAAAVIGTSVVAGAAIGAAVIGTVIVVATNGGQ